MIYCYRFLWKVPFDYITCDGRQSTTTTIETKSSKSNTAVDVSMGLSLDSLYVN